VKQLPKGATPIDFAFMVHTEVGVHCQGAKVNGRIAPLHRELRNGDTIEILTSPNAKPSSDWLSHVRTARARHKIKAWIRHQEEEESVVLGREQIARELKPRRRAAPESGRLGSPSAVAMSRLCRRFAHCIPTPRRRIFRK